MEQQQFDFIGWVPCVSGRLFFEYTECGLGRNVKSDVNHLELSTADDGYSRFIVIASTVDWKDGDDEETNGDYRVVLTGSKTSEEISLSGQVYLIPEVSNKSVLQPIEDILTEINQQTKKQETIGSLYSSLMELLDTPNQDQFYKVDYVVESSGFTKLRYGLRDKEFTHRHKYTVCRQAYYYIKYSLHKHRHHHDKAESLTTIHEYNIEKERIGIKLLNDLRKSLVQIKRDSEDFDGDNLFRACGIASYAKSLAESCCREGYLSDDDYKSEINYFESIKMSVEVMADAAERELTRSIAISGNARAVVLFAFSLIAPLLLIFRESIHEKLVNSRKPDLFIEFVATSVNSDWKILVIAAVLFLFLMVYVAVNKKFGTHFLAFKWYRKVLCSIVHENNKGTVFSIVTVVLFLGVILYELVEILTV